MMQVTEDYVFTPLGGSVTIESKDPNLAALAQANAKLQELQATINNLEHENKNLKESGSGSA
jgi:cell division protein FtsB